MKLLLPLRLLIILMTLALLLGSVLALPMAAQKNSLSPSGVLEQAFVDQLVTAHLAPRAFEVTQPRFVLLIAGFMALLLQGLRLIPPQRCPLLVLHPAVHAAHLSFLTHHRQLEGG